MFKKSLIAVAALTAFAGSAMAADITISGRIDTGLNFHDYEYKTAGEVTEDGNSFGMKTGQYSSSRVTIKGSEDLGNGMKAGFVLENGFNSDDGALAQEDKIFGREAIVYLEGGFGHFSMGRVGVLSSGVGSYNVVYGFSPWGTGWGDYAGTKGEFNLDDRSRFNNTVTYRSPEFAGVQVYAQYSFDADGQEDEHTGVNKRYAGLGATYNLGAFSTGLVVDTIMNGRDDASKNTEDSLGVSWGASYDLGVTKPMILVQYGKNENNLGGFTLTDYDGDRYDLGGGNYIDQDMVDNEGLTGYAVTLGAVTPLMGGNLYTSVSYMDGEVEGTSNFTWTASGQNPGAVEIEGDIQRWGVAVGYDYPLSKRTKLYGFATYNEGEFKSRLNGNGVKIEEQDIEAGVGLIHYF